MQLSIPGVGLCSQHPTPRLHRPWVGAVQTHGRFAQAGLSWRKSPVLDQGHPESGPNPSPNKGIGWGQEAEQRGWGMGMALAAWRTSCSWGQREQGRQNRFVFEGDAPPKPAHPTHLAQG